MIYNKIVIFVYRTMETDMSPHNDCDLNRVRFIKYEINKRIHYLHIFNLHQ